jgi:hypothetical protein
LPALSGITATLPNQAEKKGVIKDETDSRNN